MQMIGIKRNDNVKEPEDHISILFDMMSGLIRGNFNNRYFSLSEQYTFLKTY